MNEKADRLLLLDKERVTRKLRRMAWQIWEHNSQESIVSLVGIAGGGYEIARELCAHLKEICPLELQLVKVSLDKVNPNQHPIELDAELKGKSVVLIDDVANSGKTLLYALQSLLSGEPKSILIAVLVNRKHKAFPITPDIIGQQVATTLQEHIEVVFENDQIQAFLE
ncbi:MAG: phosphoribosyltransferase [Bacteroidetes bacterium]|nr:phosphoribosyltransferase [Bacteroidota bacterium]